MKQLTAQYKVELDECLVIKRREGDTPTFTTAIDGFDIRITLADRHMDGVRSRIERLMTSACYLVEVSVSRDESEAPPPLMRNDRGGDDYAVQVAYFQARTERYARTAAEALNRLFLFFRHRLRQPLSEEITYITRPCRTPAG